MEIYKGKPIFYSLGNFIFEAESMRQIPQEIYDTCNLSGDDPSEFFDRAMKGFSAPEFWQSALAMPTFHGGELSELKLYPIDLQSDLPRAQRGAPVLASGNTAKEIIDRLAQLSTPFGTRIEFRDGIGHVDVGHKQAKNFDVGGLRHRSSVG
jgi:poly-gamma-glutamate synthesis protein (capsule biosynthesis protein)